MTKFNIAQTLAEYYGLEQECTSYTSYTYHSFLHKETYTASISLEGIWLDVEVSGNEVNAYIHDGDGSRQVRLIGFESPINLFENKDALISTLDQVSAHIVKVGTILTDIKAGHTPKQQTMTPEQIKEIVAEVLTVQRHEVIESVRYHNKFEVRKSIPFCGLDVEIRLDKNGCQAVFLHTQDDIENPPVEVDGFGDLFKDKETLVTNLNLLRFRLERRIMEINYEAY